MPGGTNVSTAPALVPATDVQFLYDLTRVPPQGGELIYEQRIFDEVFRIIDEARSFIVADFFLLNEHMGAAGGAHRPLSRELVRSADRAQAGSAEPVGPADHRSDQRRVRRRALARCWPSCASAGVEVVVTDLEPLRDSNPLYSSLWRMLLQWWGNSASGGGTMQSVHQRRLEDHAAQLARAAELQGESSQADRRGSRGRHAARRWSPRRIRTTRAARTRTSRCASPARSPATSSRARWRSRASPAGADTSMRRRAEGERRASAARCRTVVHHGGSDPQASARRDRRRRATATREHRDVLSGGSQSGGRVARTRQIATCACASSSIRIATRSAARRTACRTGRSRTSWSRAAASGSRCAGIARTASSSTPRSR